MQYGTRIRKTQGKFMKTIPLKILLTGILLLSTNALAEQKLALIIGNNNYSRDIGALSNPINDAIAIDKKLKSMGFDTILIKNANKRQMLDAFDTFQEKLEHGSTAIFYYAGHGIEAGNRSYLIPVEATIPKNPNNYSDEFFDMRDKAMNSMLSSAAENKILIIDACRNSLDPIKRAVGGNTRGFSRTSMAVDNQSSNAGKMSVLFSTLSGSEALDASPFAKALLANLDKPNATWPELVSDISTTVRQNTKGTQQVWSEGGTELAYFKLLPIAQVVKPDPSPQVIERIVEKPVERIVERERVVVQENPQAAELSYWNSIKNSNRSSDFQAYINQYPNGLFVELAQAKLLPKPVEVAQVQVRDRPASQADRDVELMQQGMWRDPKTNFVWMRCSLGQTWDGNTCTGEAKKYTWQEALDAAKALNQHGFFNKGGFGGYKDWVVPHIEDLSTIRYCSTGFVGTIEVPTKAGGTKMVDRWCKGSDYQHPTINQIIFPNTNGDFYWSSSPYADDRSDAWSIGFNIGNSGSNGIGGDSYYLKGRSTYVRLVRSSQ